MAVLTYRLVKGSNLDATEFDGNTHNLDDRLVVLEALPSAAAGIVSVTLDEGTRQLTFVMDDATTRGPVTVPVFVPTFVGGWAPTTAYSRGDIITAANGSTYTVLLDHTSEATFDPGETTTDGDYYGLLLTSPDGALPAGGAAGQSLLKASGVDYEVTWGDSNIPADGTLNQFLRKTSSVDYAIAWTTLTLAHISFISAVAGHGHILRYNAVNSFWTGEPPTPVATVSTNTLTVGTSRLEKYLRFTHVDGCVITVPPAADTGSWTVLTLEAVRGQEIHLRQAAGPLTIVAGGGVTINGISGFDDGTDRVGAVVTLKYVAADTWDLFGMLAETGTA